MCATRVADASRPELLHPNKAQPGSNGRSPAGTNHFTRRISTPPSPSSAADAAAHVRFSTHCHGAQSECRSLVGQGHDGCPPIDCHCHDICLSFRRSAVHAPRAPNRSCLTVITWPRRSTGRCWRRSSAKAHGRSMKPVKPSNERLASWANTFHYHPGLSHGG